MKTDTEILIDIFQSQIDQIKAVKGSPTAKMCAEELELLLEKFRRGELTVDKCAEQFIRVELDFMKVVLA